MILDASVLLAAFFPDEAQQPAQVLLRDHAAGRRRLKAPSLILYETANAVWQAERRGRISSAQTEEILQATAGLRIELHDLAWSECLPMARQFQRSAYDAAYLALAYRFDEDMVTADERLYNAVRQRLKWVRLL
ncbi:MAG: type II toxin-antitoxin system VapC family toxin [Anaerolineales bacterium]